MWTAGTDPVTPDTLEDATWLTFGVTDTPQPPNLTQLPVVTAGLELGALLGEGSTGTVHLAYHAVLEREVAVKRLKSGSPERAMTRLLQEGRTMGSLEHPNIIPVHAIGVDHDGTPALVMKRVEGRSWRVGEDGLEADIAVLIAVSSALLHAHQNGTVHRDLKPANVMLGAHDEVYLADWGIAADDGASVLPGGTPLFMGPEMFEVARAAPSMDVYTVGSCLHLLITGEHRNQGSSLPACQIAASRRCTAARPGVDPELVALADAACAIEPLERPPLALVVQGLRTWLTSRGAVHLAAAAQERLVRLQAQEVPDATELTECLFAFRQALEQRPGHAPYIEGLCELLRLAVDDALRRDVQSDLAAGWIDELERLGADVTRLRGELEASMERQQHRESLAWDADYGLDYRDRFRVYARWMAGFGSLTGLGVLTGWIDHETHRGSLAVAVLFTGTLTVAAGLGRATLVRNQVNRALLGALFFMGVLLIANRLACGMLGVPVVWMHAWDAGILGTITFTLGLSHGAVTRRLGALMLLGVPAVLLAPTGRSSLVFVGVILCTTFAFLLATLGKLRRTR